MNEQKSFNEGFKENIEYYEFVGYGTVLEPKRSVFAVDIGNKLEEGIIDHHQIRGEQSAAALVVKNIDLVQKWNEIQPIKTIVTHRNPDFDACASSFIVNYFINNNMMPLNVDVLTKITNEVDYAKYKLGNNPEMDVVALFNAISFRAKKIYEKNDLQKDKYIIQRSSELFNYYTNHIDKDGLDNHPFNEEKKLVIKAVINYQSDIKDAIKNNIKFNNGIYDALIVNRPKSFLFSELAKSDIANSSLKKGFDYIALVYGDPDDNRYKIFISENTRDNLSGLGQKLDLLETEARGGKKNDFRYLDEPRPGYSNSDPWYDGRAHQYKIVDTPRSGTKLTYKQIKDLVWHPEKWQIEETNINELLNTIKNDLPNIAKGVIKENLDINVKENKDFIDNPDNVIMHERRWHQWGIITHTEKFLNYYQIECKKYLQDWGTSEKIKEYMSHKIDGVSKDDLIKISILFHDLGKFSNRTIYHENNNYFFSFKDHEKASGKIIRSEKMKNYLKKYNITEKQIEYIARCAELHYEFGLTRDRAYGSNGYNFEFVKSDDCKVELDKVINEKPEFAVEIGLLYLADSLAKLELHLKAETTKELDKQTETIEEFIKKNKLYSNLDKAARQLTVTIAMLRRYFSEVIKIEKM